MKSVIEVYKSFSLVFITRPGFSTVGNILEIGSTRWRSLNPIDNNDKHVNLINNSIQIIKVIFTIFVKIFSQISHTSVPRFDTRSPTS